MDQVATLTTGWEPDTPLDDSVLRQFVFAYADRVAWMAQATHGGVDRDAAACIADVDSAFGYDNAAVLLQPPTQTALLAVLNRARQLFPPGRWWVLLSAWPLPGPPPDGMLLVGHPPLMLRPPGPFSIGQPPGLRILPVNDQPSLADFDTVLNAAYPLPGGTAVADRRLLGYDLHLLVGYDREIPVATAGARTAGGIVEVDWVSTCRPTAGTASGRPSPPPRPRPTRPAPQPFSRATTGAMSTGSSASWTSCASRSGNTNQPNPENQKGDNSMTAHDTARDALTAIDPEHLAGLADQFGGDLLGRDDDGYEEHRRVWNGMIDKHPALIARCHSTNDVVSVVNFARERDLLLAVRGGGHSFAGFSTCDGGVVLDLSPMQAVDVDPDRRVARAQGGATWSVFDAATHAQGLACTGGLISTTGVAGLTLGGGIGWLQRRCGLACDNLLSVELVTAAGEVVRASEAENAELFWGLRGGGGNFGVAASFEFRLHPISDVTGGLMLFESGRAGEVMRFYRDFVRGCPDELTTWLSVITAPTADFVPETLRSKVALAVLACHCGEPADAEIAIRPLRELGPAADLVERMPYPQLQSMLDEDLPPGVRCYLKAGYTPELTEPLIDAIVAHTTTMPSASSTLDLHHMGGAVARVADDATAFGDRQSAFCFNIVGVWQEAIDDDTNRTWVRDLASALEPFGTGGVYVNFTAEPGQVRSAYGDKTTARLRALKTQYDPTNLFRLNQNIPG